MLIIKGAARGRKGHFTARICFDAPVLVEDVLRGNNCWIADLDRPENQSQIAFVADKVRSPRPASTCRSFGILREIRTPKSPMKSIKDICNQWLDGRVDLTGSDVQKII